MVFKIFPSLLRRRGCLLIIFGAIIVPFTIFVLIISPDLKIEKNLSQRLAECQMRLQFLESMYRTKQEDVSILSQYLGLGAANTNTSDNNSALSNFNNVLESLSPESKAIIKNLSSSMTHHRFASSQLRLPSAYHFLPHLLDDPASLRPALLVSKGRSGVSIVLGIPTVKRDKQTYLINTLENLIMNMDDDEQNDTMIVVFVGETDLEYVQSVAKDLQRCFHEHIESGLIEVISPPASYYPDMNKLRITLNDPLERVKWRSKQNLDFSFLMAYSQTKATFYVQLEDDILAKRGYISIMKQFAVAKTVKEQDSWFVLDFCQLGFIGKMFKSAELPWLITFFQMFYNDKPVDWLLEHLIYTKVCNFEKDMKHCKFEKAKLWVHYKPSLFQHIGMTSSLRGKVQKLKDRQFGKIPTFYPHKDNPLATVKTQISSYKNYNLSKAYSGETFFWGLLPQAGDYLDFLFNQPTAIKKYLFRSGSMEHPSDKLYNTTVEILPDQLNEESLVWQQYNTTTDGFLIIGSFSAMGLAEGVVDSRVGKLREMRLHIHTDSENWVILSEIHLTKDDGKGTR